MPQRWLGTGLFYCEGQFKKVTGDAEVTQVIVALAAEHAERFRFRRRRQRETTRGPRRKLSTDVLPTSVAPSCRGAVRMMNSASRDSYPDEPGFVSQTAQGKTLSILCWKGPRTE